MIGRSLYTRSALAMTAIALMALGTVRQDVQAASSDIVLYASGATSVRGNWARLPSTTGAGGTKLTSTDRGWSRPEAPQASPTHYFDVTFQAPANTPFRIWLRLRAAGNSKWNDSVYVQFSDSVTTAGAAEYRIGSSRALTVNLERCRDCGMSGWGWRNSAYWLDQASTIRFATTGTHKVRIQTREDGVDVDQIVLSPVTYMSRAPGTELNDTTVLPKSTSTSIPTPRPTTGVSTPYLGSPVSLPGVVLARNFDNGGKGVAYYDSTAGNSGSDYRQSDVDLQDSSLGGHNVGWTSPGEWLKYTVTVPTAGTYAISTRVANGGDDARINVSFSRSNVSKTLTVNNTGDWQEWEDVTFTAALAAGQQVLKLSFPQGGVNVLSVKVARPTTPAQSDDDEDDDDGGAVPIPSGSSGGTFRMLTWNIHHGITRSGKYDPAAQARFIVSQNPHVVVLQEVQTWDENQPAKYKALLEQLTGVRWHLQWAPVIHKSSTEGNLVLTRLPVVSSSYRQMHATGDWSAMYSNRSVARTTVKVGGVPVHVFSTHLDWYNRSHRTAQLLDMMAWTESFGPRRVVGGDFNSWWGEYWITTMMSDYIDTWQAVTGSNQNGYTVNNAVRFDYLFRSKEGADKVIPRRVWTPSTSLSDHNPVIADFVVKP